MSWAYDAGEPWKSKKHWWDEPYAGIRQDGNRKRGFVRVSCCPNDVTKEEATKVLNDGLPYALDPGGPPRRIFNVFRGVPYEAKETSPPGKSFHAFPILPERYVDLPDVIRDYLEEKAGPGVIEQWLKQWRAH